MIRANGATLRIKKIRQSRNGAFCVADLSTDFGEFKVKDTILDQFEEGEYQATVWISEIFLAQYISYGKAVTEMRARLHELQVDSAAQLDDSRSEPTEPDPLDEERLAAKVAPAAAQIEDEKPKPSRLDALRIKLQGVGTRKGKATPADKEPEASNDASHLKLFGEAISGLIQNREAVKLDATIDRAVLRQQAAMMHQLDYIFDPKQQIWNPK